MSVEKYLIFDTETTGLFDFSKPADADGQPRCAHLAMIALRGDTVWLKVNGYASPDGWSMPEAASKINGITDDILKAKGIPIGDLLKLYASLIDDGHIAVAYNVDYDLKIMRGELRRAKADDRFAVTRSICVMRPLVDICKIEKQSPGGGYKFPKLREAMQFFGLQQKDEHRALGDAESALMIFRELRKRGVELTPRTGTRRANKSPV